VGSIPVTTVVESGRTEKSGDILFTSVPYSGSTVTGTITIDYGVPITYAGSVSATATDAATAPDIDNVVVENLTQLVFTVIPDAANPSSEYFIRVSGVRVDVAGDPGAVPLNAQISTTGNAITTGESNPRVINAARAGIASLTGGGAVQINSVTGYISGATGTTLDALEGFRSAFGLTVDAGQSTPQRIRVILDQRLPTGLTIQFPEYDNSGLWQRIGDGTISYADGSSPYVDYQVYADTNQTAVEHFQLISLTVDADPAADRGGAYPDVIIHASVSLAPIDTASPTAVPRYVYVPVGSVPIVTFFHPTTTLLLPFSVNSAFVADQPHYQTGMAIANTTLDPTNMGVDQAVPQDGAFTIYLYRDTGATYSVASSALPQKDILAAGVLGRGKTYTVLLSEVLDAASASEDFSGYIFIVTQFTNAHGEYFVFDDSNITNFTHGALMLVIDYDRDIEVEYLDN
jgi:hypothetical protein